MTSVCMASKKKLLAEGVTLTTCDQDVLGSNLGYDCGYTV